VTDDATIRAVHEQRTIRAKTRDDTHRRTRDPLAQSEIAQLEFQLLLLRELAAGLDCCP
jgi:hypothetical protein